MKPVQWLAAFFWVLSGFAAWAQSCSIAPDLPEPRLVRVDNANPKAGFDSYALALSWSPHFCSEDAQARRPANAHQCQDNSFGFVVHGLWPQNSRAQNIGDHPRFCPIRSTFVSRETLKRYACMMPSVQLMQGQWQKHGGCAFASPEAYFSQTAKLYQGLRLPDPEALARTAKPLTVGALRMAFVNANPGWKGKAIFVSVDNRMRLREIRLCYTLNYMPEACKRIGAPDRLPLVVIPRVR